MSENKQNSAPIAADFMQNVGKEGMIDFEPFTKDREDGYYQLKVTFLTLPDTKIGKLVYGSEEKNIKVKIAYAIDTIKYIADKNSIEETKFTYYITDSDKSKSDSKTVVINSTSEQKMDGDSQLIGTEGDDILIADSNGALYLGCRW